MSRHPILRTLSLLAVVLFPAVGGATPAVEPPDELDKKGFFVLPQDLVRHLKIKSVTTSDWLQEADGTLRDRERGVHAEYDTSGRLISFAGHVDRQGYMELEYRYDDEDRLVEKRLFSKDDDVRTLEVSASFDYSKPKTKERVMRDGDGSIVDRMRYVFDDAGRIVKIQKLKIKSGRPSATVKRTYDSDGNFVEEYGDAGRTTHTVEINVLTVSSYAGPRGATSTGELRGAKEYTFDDNGNLLSYYRRSGDGSYWDRFTYELDELGLPITMVWSRLELILQEPYQLTKYSYEYHE